MIRKALLFIVLASLATVAGAREANVFASGLKASHVEGAKYDITYSFQRILSQASQKPPPTVAMN